MDQRHDYILKTQKYNKHIEDIIVQEYDLEIKFLNLINWGYNTTAFYLETSIGKLILRLSTYSEEKLQVIQKDILISELLADVLPIPHFIKSKRGNLICVITDEQGVKRILRLSDHMEGVMPFNPDKEVIHQTATFLKKLHTQVPAEKLTLLKKSSMLEIKENAPAVLVHGDLTPSNVLISHNKLVRVVDFENACIGPKEIDLARSSVFFWFRMPNFKFEEVLCMFLDAYNDEVNSDMLYDFSRAFLVEHVENVTNSKEVYESENAWNEDIKFSKQMLAKFNA